MTAHNKQDIIRKDIKSHLHKYYKELRVGEAVYVKKSELHPDCCLRSPTTCKSSDDIVEIEICGEMRKFCKSCSFEMQSRFKKALEQPQMHYWQVAGNLIKR